MDEPADVEMCPSPPMVKSMEISSKWLEKFRNGTLIHTDFEQHWSEWVPKIYSPKLNDNCLTWSFNEDRGLELLFNVLEEFMFDGESGGDVYNAADVPSSVCGRFFKMGEPNYSCRECGVDKTCVLCVDCFKHSQHRFHKYRMSTSSGGGCCDCGDIEAWRRDPFCTLHTVPENTNSDNLPTDLKVRMQILFDSILNYTDDLLNTDKFVDDGLAARTPGCVSSSFGVDAYCTILYNDEIHTFEQVITTLTRVLKCNQRSSTDFVTSIDREGRAVVKCAPFNQCLSLKEEIEKYTSRHGSKPLKVSVCHAHVIAHQIYAMKLLTWLQKILGYGKGFRTVFTECALKPRQGQSGKPAKDCVVKEIMRRDSSLWKSARTQWHKLLASGMLMEYENKKALAKIYTKNYGQIMKDFIKDDHEHSFSISSLSVQLFTVPTLAHHLIAHDEILYTLLNTLISEYSRKLNKDRKLEFERNPTYHTFKRSLFMLHDLKFLLGAVPENWTDDLRRNFLHGLSMMLHLFTMMQGMDTVVRQVGQHMEYEPEWESAFNLHLKLAGCITSAVEWCSTDKVVLVKAYRMVLKKLEENPCYEPSEAGEVRELADHSTACLHYDVSSKPISIHLPLTRFLAAVHLHLEKFGMHFDGTEFQGTKPTPVQIIEPVLRAQVMIAQVHAGMWRRNGYALLNTLFFYHNVKCRTEMLDRDITLLQIGASLIESNEFLIHMLNKFNLINWASPDFEINTLKSPEEDSMRQTINLVEEFLHLLIVIVGERHMPGVSNVTPRDRIKKELVQSLCIKSAPHSELVKTLPEELQSLEFSEDDIIHEVATFKKPSNQSSAKGVYELKEEFYEEFNLFFYHYTREELSKADEAQRKRRLTAGQLECCPPPKLPRLSDSFTLLVNLLQCDVTLHVIRTVFERCLNLRARSFSESQLHKTLHLIGYAMNEEESGHYPFFKFMENAAKFHIFDLMEELVKSPRVDAHKGLLLWTLERYKKLGSKDEVVSSLKSDQDVSSENEPSTSTATSSVDAEKERRAKLAAERRAKIMAQMQAMQKNFMKENASLFEDACMDTTAACQEDVTTDMDVVTAVAPPEAVALGPKHSGRNVIDKTYTCILCQEEERISADGKTMVLAAFVQQATVLCQYKNNDALMNVNQHDYLYLHANLGPAPHVSTCGHVMHSECWQKYFDSVMVREHRRPYRLRHPSSFDVDKQEFLCPLCECLSNTVLTIVPSITRLNDLGMSNNESSKADVVLSLDDWIQNIDLVLQYKVLVCHGLFTCEDCTNTHCKACLNASNGISLDQNNYHEECEVNSSLQPYQVCATCTLQPHQFPNQRFVDIFPSRNGVDLTLNMKDMIILFANVTYTRGLNANPNLTDKRLLPLLWKSLAYTVHSIEVLLRESHKPLLGQLTSRQRDCIENLVRLVGIAGSTLPRGVVINSHALTLLSYVFEHSNKGPSILQWDSFSMLISLTFSLPGLLRKKLPTPPPSGNNLEWYVMRVVFTCHMVRILILTNFDDQLIISNDDDCDLASDDDRYSVIVDILKLLNKYRDNYDMSQIWEYMKEITRPFLRCSVLLFHYLCDATAPSDFSEYGGDTFESMCAYLDLPTTPIDLFGSPMMRELVRRWCEHSEVRMFLGGLPLQVIHEPVPIPHLIDLPEDYSDLVNQVATFTCPNSEENARNPALCLVCGVMLCSQGYCCQKELEKVQVGAANYHASKCGGGVGIFLRVRDCEILMLATPHRGCFTTAPYLDAYGETDQGLKRGNPLKLCAERYNRLQKLWLGHSVHEEIARQIENSNNIVTTQWNLL